MADEATALERLGALGHETRLEALRLLIAAGADDLAAGDLAERLGVRENALSPHLDRLVRAGLATRRRDGRRILYSADETGIAALMRLLLDECCDGRPELCGPAAAFWETVR